MADYREHPSVGGNNYGPYAGRRYDADIGKGVGSRYESGKIPTEYRVQQTQTPMTREDRLRYNIESALRPMYEQSIAQLDAQRRAQNAAIDVDAYSRGMGGSTWVTDAKLQALRGMNANIATLDANYNNQLYTALQNALKSSGGGGGGKSTPDPDPTSTDPDPINDPMYNIYLLGRKASDALKKEAARKAAGNVFGSLGSTASDANVNPSKTTDSLGKPYRLSLPR